MRRRWRRCCWRRARPRNVWPCLIRVSSSTSPPWAGFPARPPTSTFMPVKSWMREITNQLLSKHSGQKLDKVEKDVERDFIMNAQQAKEYGIIDDIIYKTK